MSAVGSNRTRTIQATILFLLFSEPVAASQQTAFKEMYSPPPRTSPLNSGSVDGKFPTLRLPLEVMRVRANPSNNTLSFGDENLSYNMTCLSDTLGNGDVICRGVYLGPDVRVYRKTLTRGYVRSSGVNSEIRIESDSTFTEIESGTGIEFHYDTNGNLDRIEDSNGRKILIARNMTSQVTQVSDEAGRTITFSYNGALITQAGFSSGGLILYEYSQTMRGYRISRITNLANEVSAFTYDETGNMVAYSNPASTSLSYELGQSPLQLIVKDSSGNEVGRSLIDEAGGGSSQISNASGLVSARGLDFRGLVISETNSRGATNFMDFDADLNLIQSATNYDTATYRYDARGNVVTSRHSTGETFLFEYDTFARITKVVSPLGHAETFAYDSRGNITSHKAPSGGVFKYSYDTIGNRTRVEDPDGSVNIISHSDLGFIVSRTSCDCPGGEAFQTISYDAYGYIQSIGNGNDTVVFSRDALGREVTKTLPGGARISTVISAAGPTSISNSATGETVTYSYSSGLLGRMTDATGAASEITYDASRRLSSFKNPLSHSTNYLYDSAANLSGVIFPTNPLGAPTRAYVSDSANRVIKYTRETGDVIEYTYDALGRILARKVNGSTVATFTYDTQGRITKAEDPIGATTFERDALGRATSIGYANGTAIDFDYSNAGRLKRISTSGYTSDISYDSAGRLMTIGTEAGNISTSYDSFGRVIKLEYPNGVSAVYSYGPTGGTSRVEYLGVGNDTVVFEIGRDSSNRIVRLIRSDLNETETIKYSSRGEIIEGEIQRTSDTIIFQYSYDSAGNRTRLLDNMGTTTYQYDPGNLLDTAGVGYGYNPAGEVTSIGARNISYTADGMIRSDTTSLGAIVYDYDAFNRRVRSKIGSDTQIWRLWDEAGNEIADATDQGAISEFRYYVPGVMDRMLGFTRGDRTFFTLADPAGNVAMVIDESGVIVARYAYDPFHIRLDSSFDSVVNQFQFASRRVEASGEVYIRARSLESTTGRFMQRDPLFIGNSRDPFSWNGFIYSNSDALNNSDPTGLACDDDFSSSSFILYVDPPVITHIDRYNGPYVFVNVPTNVTTSFGFSPGMNPVILNGWGCIDMYYSVVIFTQVTTEVYTGTNDHGEACIEYKVKTTTWGAQEVLDHVNVLSDDDCSLVP